MVKLSMILIMSAFNAERLIGIHLNIYFVECMSIGSGFLSH